MVTTHYGQHDPDKCFACKMKSIQVIRPGPKTHQRNGDPWEGNPVLERINEIQAEGRRVSAFELSSDNQGE
jgi:hypothetical protein